MSGNQISSAMPKRSRAGTLMIGVSALALAIAGSVSTSGEALARKKPSQNPSAFSFFDSAPAPRKQRTYRVYNEPNPAPRSKDSKSAGKEAPPTEKPIRGPVVLSVSLSKQRVTVYDIDGPIAESPISSGQPAFPTLTGVFTLLEKSVVHHSNIYGGAPMPYMERITWSGTALHAGDLPGYPASHGCIRLPYNFSKKLYTMTRLGTRVIVARDPVPPAPFTHPNLIAPLPPEAVTASLADAVNGTSVAGVETKVAEQRDYESVRSLLLARTASAAEPIQTGSTPAPQTGLTGYRAKRAEEKQQTADALAAAQAGKIETELAAKAAVLAADQAKAAAKQAHIEAERRAQEAKKAEQARLDGDRALAEFSKQFAGDKALRSDIFEKAAQSEQQLEDKTFELGRNLETTRAAAATAKSAATEADARVPAAAAVVKEKAQKLTKIGVDIKTAQATLESFKRQELVRKYPVSVFISRSAGRLFVRQGYEPMFDVPVTIKDPEVAIGTHVFTALELTGPAEMRWSAASIPYNTAPAPELKKSKKNAQYEVKTVSAHLPQTPAAALDRVTIPEDVRERIADVLKPGSSIMISDYGISNQTGKFTDFIVLTR